MRGDWQSTKGGSRESEALRTRLEAVGLTQPVQPRVDPYLEWAALCALGDGTGPRSSSWLPVLLRVEGAAQDFAEGSWTRESEDLRDFDRWCRVPKWYRSPPPGLAGSPWCTAWVTRRFFEQLTGESPLSKRVKSCVVGWSAGLASPRAEEAADTCAVEPRVDAHRVLVTVIDDGIAFAHARFRDVAGKTKVEAFWDQRQPSPSPYPAASMVPPYGQALIRTEINDLLARHTRGGLVDEDALYRGAGNADVGRRGRHGTHVMDLACGWPSSESKTPMVAAVQLPRAVALDTTGHLLAPSVLDALYFTLDLEARLRKGGDPIPVVVNLSYGIHAGPHDGSSALEMAMDNLIESRNSAKCPLAIVIPAGNSLLSRCHASVSLSKEQARVIEWRIPPDHPRTTFLELWLPHKQAACIELKLTTPTGSFVYVQPYGTWCLLQGGDPNAVLATVSYREAATSLWNASRDMVLISVASTRFTGDTNKVAPAGTWRLEIRNLITADIQVDAWIERTDSPYGFARTGPQSRFEDAGYAVYDGTGAPVEEDPHNDSPVSRTRTLNGIATGSRTIVVGAARADRRRPARYASSGPAIAGATGVPTRQGPDVSSTSDDVGTRRGVLGAGTRSAGVVALNGSSVAAPQVTRRIAALMSSGVAIDRATVQTELPQPPIAPPDERMGHGFVAPAASGRPDRLTGKL
jgi:hypothetical protein